MFVDLNDVMPRISFCAYSDPMFHLSECLPLSFMNHTSIKANKKSIKCLSESMGDAIYLYTLALEIKIGVDKMYLPPLVVYECIPIIFRQYKLFVYISI